MTNNIGTEKNKQRNRRTILLCIISAVGSFSLTLIGSKLSEGSLLLSKPSIGFIVLASSLLLFAALLYEYIKRDEFEKVALEKAITFTAFMALLGFPWYLLGLAEITNPFNPPVFLFLLAISFLGFFVYKAIADYRSEENL